MIDLLEYQKVSSVSECYRCWYNFAYSVCALIFKIIKVKFSGYGQRFTPY